MNPPDHRTRVGAQRRERMRSRLLDSALELIARSGPAAMMIDDVISQAEVSRGTFYKYFDTPDALARELALELSNELLRMVEPLVQQVTDPAERIAIGMRMVVSQACKHPSVGSFFVRLGWPDMDRRHLLFEVVQRDLEEGMRQGQFAAMPIGMALNIVSGMVVGALHVALTQTDQWRAADHAAASALRALGVDAERAARIVAMPLPQASLIEGGLLARTVGEAEAKPAPVRAASARAGARPAAKAAR